MPVSDLFCRPCIASMSPWDFAIWTSLLVAASVFLLYRCKKQFHRHRLIEDMPTSKIRSASQGYTELVGIARQDTHPRIAPLSSELCIWWRYTIERYQRSGKSSHWQIIEKKQSRSPFFLEDTTGRCRVQPDNGEITTAHKRVWYGNSRRPVSSPLKGSGLLSRSIGMGRYRYTEHQIRDGDPLYVLGHFESDSAGRQSLHVEKLAGDILRTWKADYAALLARFDVDGGTFLAKETMRFERVGQMPLIARGSHE